MFSRDNVPVRVASITHNQMERDEAEIPLVVMSCEVNPLTAELAGELHDFVRGTLYTRTGTEVNSLLGSASFALVIPPQAVQWRAANDQAKPVITIDEAKISNIGATRSKKSAAWTLKFTITLSPASDKQLGKLVERYLKISYLTFAPAEPGLFDEKPEAPKGRRVSEAEEQAQAEERDEDLPMDESDEAPATH